MTSVIHAFKPIFLEVSGTFIEVEGKIRIAFFLRVMAPVYPLTLFVIRNYFDNAVCIKERRPRGSPKCIAQFNRLITFKHSKYILKVRLWEVQFTIITPANSFMSYSVLPAVLNFIQGMAVNKSVSDLHVSELWYFTLWKRTCNQHTTLVKLKRNYGIRLRR